MDGKHIGALTVILKTNQSETLIWQKRGNLGDKWMFAQTTLKHKDKYKVRSNMQPKAKIINNMVRKLNAYRVESHSSVITRALIG
jgi:hypothetical protein